MNHQSQPQQQAYNHAAPQNVRQAPQGPTAAPYAGSAQQYQQPVVGPEDMPGDDLPF